MLVEKKAQIFTHDEQVEQFLMHDLEIVYRLACCRFRDLEN